MTYDTGNNNNDDNNNSDSNNDTTNNNHNNHNNNMILIILIAIMIMMMIMIMYDAGVCEKKLPVSIDVWHRPSIVDETPGRNKHNKQTNKQTPFMRAFALQNSISNCSPPLDSACFRPTLPRVFFSGGVFLSDTGMIILRI